MATDTDTKPASELEPASESSRAAEVYETEAYLRRGLLRLLTCGSVDDGKSTLIGRLLHDSKSIFEDQLEAVRGASIRRGDERVNLALLTDGLRAEREQGITIDVAYRFFSTPRRKFIIADTPGHVQYTRNMVTGASTANLAVILIDARVGVIEQTRRHAFLASLLRIPNILVAVNKMDLVGWSESVFTEIKRVFETFAEALSFDNVEFMPLSALLGDNVVHPSKNMPWHEGPSFLRYIEEVGVPDDLDDHHDRFPVQWIIRPQSAQWPDFRGYAGTIASGRIRAGDRVRVLPGNRETTVTNIWIGEEKLEEVVPPMPATLELADDIDISRGDMIVDPNNPPRVGNEFEAMVVWMAEEPMRVRKKYSLKHATRDARCIVKELRYRLDISDLSQDASANSLELNQIGRISLKTTKPLFYDRYEECRATGSFIIIDEATNNTVGAGMIL
ncbi:MAG: sulfate adenylyltransferase [Myxococcales bacterium]|nr:sulfate adenylyltransferase [Myxococcales bacterium]